MSSPPPRADERVLFERRSAYQHVALSEEPGGHVAMTLDDVWQFHSRDEHVFHEVLADTAMILAPAPRRALILGGGDGLALRNVLRYAELEAATLCELDPAVIEMATQVPEMVALNEDAFADPRVELVVDDARALIEARAGLEPGYDVIICDFPAATSAELEDLFGPALFAGLAGLCQRDSVISVQVSQDAAGFWPVCAAVEASFAWVHPMLVNLDLSGADGCDWADFVLASARPRAPARPVASATRFMAAELVEQLHIQNRGGARFETLAYGSIDM